LATEESSTTMKVAVITEAAIIHGLAEGLQLPGPASADCAALLIRIS